MCYSFTKSKKNANVTSEEILIQCIMYAINKIHYLCIKQCFNIDIFRLHQKFVLSQNRLFTMGLTTVILILCLVSYVRAPCPPMPTCDTAACYDAASCRAYSGWINCQCTPFFLPSAGLSCYDWVL